MTAWVKENKKPSTVACGDDGQQYFLKVCFNTFHGRPTHGGIVDRALVIVAVTDSHQFLKPSSSTRLVRIVLPLRTQ